MKRKYAYVAFFLSLASCVKPESEMPCCSDGASEDQILFLKSLLAERNTKWSVDELAVPQEQNGYREIYTDKELAFLLEFGSSSGEKFRLMNDIDISQSGVADKLSSETGVESFGNLEFDGNGKTISGLELPWAAGLFSRVNNAKIYDLTLSGCAVGSESNISNLHGTGLLIGSASGEVTVTDVTVSGCRVCAPCKVGGFVGTVTDASCVFTRCKVVDTNVSTLYFKGISGWCGGFAGFIGRSQEKNVNINVSVVAEECVVSGGKVQAHMESATRCSGTFLGSLNGYDSNEVFSMDRCTVSTVFEGLDANASSYESIYADRLIGGHKYMEGSVYFDGLAYAFPWDGTTRTQPALVNGAYMVYTAAELAWFQGKTVAEKIFICRDIDLAGKTFAPIYKASYVDGKKADGTNSEIRNLKVCRTKCGKEDGGAFIRQASGTTVHQNITFRNASIEAFHDPDGDSGNAYSATLCGNIVGTYTMKNVHAYDGYVYGVNKMGGLLGRVYTSAATISDCTVTGYLIKNYEVPEKPETFSKTMAGITVSETFYPQGEVGGMIGFIQGSANLTNCHVYTTQINASGQKDIVKFLFITIPGRHVGAAIGDIRSSNTAHAVNLDNVSADARTFELADSAWLTKQSKAEFVGKCYCVLGDDKGTIKVNGTSISF